MREGFAQHIYYKIIGKGEPLLMIAGLGADHSTWSPLVSYLRDDFKVILFDNRGIGKSTIPDENDCTIDAMADDILMLINSLKIEKLHLIGHSLGGYIAQEFSARHPERIKKLILLSTKSKSQPVQKLYLENTIKMMQHGVPREIIIRNSLCWLFSNHYLLNSENINNATNIAMQKPLEQNRKSYFYQVNAALNFDTTQSARKITSPTLIIAGDHDMLVTQQDVKDLNEIISSSQLEIIKHMGHLPHIEVPEKIAIKIINFM